MATPVPPNPINGTITSTAPSSPISSVELPSSTPEDPTDLSTSASLPPSSSIGGAATTSSVDEPPTSSIADESTTPTTTDVAVTTVITRTPEGDSTRIVIETSTSTRAVSTNVAATTNSAATEAAASASATSDPKLASGSKGDDGGLKQGPKIAIAVVVPVVVVALLLIAGLWFWRKRKQRKDAEDLRRKEMEEYGFNPNHDPTVPAVGGGGSTNGDETSTVRETDGGYRGWGGTTTSTNRKASTTMSSNPGMARSDSGGNGYKGQPSPTGGMTQISDAHSGDPLVGNGDETIGALGAAPAASGNRGGVNRGPSNASSAYSAANRSDVSGLSGDGPLPNGSPPYPQDYMYPDESNQNGYDGQPVIREVAARRNTRIENPSVVPQQGNAGISQNF